MRLVLKDEKYTFTVTKAAEPRTEYGSGQQKMNRASKLPEWIVEVLAMDSERGEVIRVTVTGDQPKSPGSARPLRGAGSHPLGQRRPRRRGLPRRRDSSRCAGPRRLNPGSDGARMAGRHW